MLTNEQILEIEDKIHYTFKNKSWLNMAFTRRSYAEDVKMQTGKEIVDNEQLEFYGDTVLKYLVVNFVSYSAFKVRDWDGKTYVKTEEQLSNFLSFWTDKTMLSSKIQELDIAKYLLMSKGDINKKVYSNLGVMEDLFEAIVGAIWFDNEKNIEEIKSIIYKLLEIDLEWVCYEKNPYTILKEFIDKNPDFVTLMTKTDDGYKFVIKSKERNLSHTANIKCIRTHNYHVAQAEGAKEAIEYLKDKGVWDGNKRIVSPNVTVLTAVNKLQELFQKKIIKVKPEYNAEYDYIYGEWVVTCKLGDGSEFKHSETSKVDAKKFAAMKAYDYILNNQNKLDRL